MKLNLSNQKSVEYKLETHLLKVLGTLGGCNNCNNSYITIDAMLRVSSWVRCFMYTSGFIFPTNLGGGCLY